MNELVPKEKVIEGEVCSAEHKFALAALYDTLTSGRRVTIIINGVELGGNVRWQHAELSVGVPTGQVWLSLKLFETAGPLLK